MITSIELAEITGMDHMACCITCYEVLEDLGKNPRNFQVYGPDYFYYVFDDEFGQEIIPLLEEYAD